MGWERMGVEMARMEGEITINRPVEDVFDFVADERNEPRYHEMFVDEPGKFNIAIAELVRLSAAIG